MTILRINQNFKTERVIANLFFVALQTRCRASSGKRMKTLRTNKKIKNASTCADEKIWATEPSEHGNQLHQSCSHRQCPSPSFIIVVTIIAVTAQQRRRWRRGQRQQWWPQQPCHNYHLKRMTNYVQHMTTHGVHVETLNTYKITYTKF